MKKLRTQQYYEHFRRTGSTFLAYIAIAALVLLMTGCIGGKRPGQLVEEYALEYRPPLIETSGVEETIKVELFTAARDYNTRSMVYRPEPYKRDVYRFHRWRANPGDMVTDYILRDLQNAGFLRAVFSYYDAEDTRFVLVGGVVEFLENDSEEGRKASIALTVTLLDTSQQRLPDRVVFQNGYRSEVKITDNTPAGFAASMSKGMEDVSMRLIADIYTAIKDL
jgi:cholesterol transport system auxiliary component